MSQRETLTHWIISAVKKRLRINLRLRNLDNITVRFTREELRQYADTSRIENNTVAQIKARIKHEGWDIEGADKAQEFVLTVPVRKLLGEFDSLESLREYNTKHSGMLLGTQKRPSVSEKEAA